SKSEILDDLVVLLGGRAAEEIVFKDITTGAENDLKRATQIARKVVAELGMSEKIGPVSWSDESEETFLARELFQEVNYSDETAKEIDLEIKRLINESYEKAKTMLLEQKEKLDLIANYLLDKETISGEELKNLLDKDVNELKTLIDSLLNPKSPEYERVPHYEYFIRKNKFIEG
ncbi:MAG: cell division protein FtsH, partial [Defluviitoga tunisiensis]